MWMLQACSMRKCHIFAYARSISLFTMYMISNCWNAIKIISNIQWYFPCLIDERIAKTCKKIQIKWCQGCFFKEGVKIIPRWAWLAIISCGQLKKGKVDMKIKLVKFWKGFFVIFHHSKTIPCLSSRLSVAALCSLFWQKTQLGKGALWRFGAQVSKSGSSGNQAHIGILRFWDFEFHILYELKDYFWDIITFVYNSGPSQGGDFGGFSPPNVWQNS